MLAIPPLSRVNRDAVIDQNPKLLRQFVQGAQVARRGIEKPIDSFRQTSFTTWSLIAGSFFVALSQCIFIWWTNVGMILVAVSLVALTALAITREEVRVTAISISILPLAELVHASIITHNAFQSAAVLYATLLLLALPYRYLFTLDEPVEFSSLRLKGHVFGLPLMLVLGECLGLVGFGFLGHAYPYRGISLPLVCMATVVFAFAEEMLLRGLIQQQAGKVIHPLWAAILTAVLYVPFAVNRANLLTIGPAIAMGVVLAAVYHVKHNLLLSTAINAAAKLTYIGLVAALVLR